MSSEQETTRRRGANAGPAPLLERDGFAEGFSSFLGDRTLSEWVSVYDVDPEKIHLIDGRPRRVCAGFQPSVVLDQHGTIHVFFQARLDTSEDEAEKMIGHVVSRDFGRSFSETSFVSPMPMQTYAVSSYLRQSPAGGQRICLLTTLSIDETVSRWKDPALIAERLGIDVHTFSRKGGSLLLEFYSDDGGVTWTRKEHPGLQDRVYPRNGRNFYLAFFNTIGQVRKMESGPFSGRLIIGGHVMGDYLPCPDHPHFRDYPRTSSLIFSDDDGDSWQFGGIAGDETAFLHGESSAVPVDGGKRILLVCRRNYDPDINERGQSAGKIRYYSDDGGETWGPGCETGVPATQCLQILETHGDTVLCSSPAKKNRTHGCIYQSRDQGRTWTPKCIEEAEFSYSTVNRLSGPYYLCCFSLRGHGSKGLAARIFSTDWLVPRLD